MAITELFGTARREYTAEMREWLEFNGRDQAFRAGTAWVAGQPRRASRTRKWPATGLEPAMSSFGRCSYFGRRSYFVFF